MIKTVGLFERRDDLTREAFRSYYEEKHAPLGASLLDFAGYARNYPSSDAARAQLGIDGFSEFWFPDAYAIHQLRERMQGEVGEQLAQDEQRFMRRESSHSYEVRERAYGERPQPGEALRAIAIVRLPAGSRSGERERSLHAEPTRVHERKLPGVIATLHSLPIRAMKAPLAGTPGIGCIESLWVTDPQVLHRCNRLRAEAGATPLSPVDEAGSVLSAVE